MGKIRPGGQQRDFYLFIYFVYGWFFFSGNFFHCSRLLSGPRGISGQPMGGQGLGVLSFFLFFNLSIFLFFYFLAMLSAVVAAGNPFISCHHKTRY